MRRHDTDLIDHSRFEGTLCLSFDELSCAEWHNDEAVTVVSTAELDALLAERDALRARKAVGKWQLLNGGEWRFRFDDQLAGCAQVRPVGSRGWLAFHVGCFDETFF